VRLVWNYQTVSLKNSANFALTFSEVCALRLEAVMNSIRNGLGMRETEIVKQPTRSWNPHFYAIFARVHNTL
jgi:hypothetical protein